MSGVNRWASLPLCSTVNGAASSAYGQSGSANNRPLDVDTVFEIGSITKVFTALLFADMVLRGEVAPDDPAAKFLPASVKMPEFEGTPITLLDLATYTSGLPRMPSNFAPKDPEQSLYRLHRRAALRLPVEPQARLQAGQARYEYANLGFGLLGHIARAARAAGAMRSSSSRAFAHRSEWTTRASRFRASMQQRLARGHDASLAPVANWDFSAFAGAGALRSTANDLLEVSPDVPGARAWPRRRRA